MKNITTTNTGWVSKAVENLVEQSRCSLWAPIVTRKHFIIVSESLHEKKAQSHSVG